MADYHGVLVGTPFIVKDGDAFEKEIRKLGLRQESEGNSLMDAPWYDKCDDEFQLYGDDVSLEPYVEDANGDSEQVDLHPIIQKHLAKGQIATFKEVGNTKCIYDETGGWATVITNTSIRHHSLDQWIEQTTKQGTIE